MRDQDPHASPVWRMRWLVLVGFAVLYGVCLPNTVQNLDSGELVASAWRLMVPHPPGYPLYVWLQHVLTRVFAWGSVYHRAALTSALCVLGVLALLLRGARSWLGVALVVVFGTIPVVWRYAVLPDVFGLHLLLSIGLVTLAFEPGGRYRVWLAGVVFGLGAANHQSIIFLLPLLLLIAWEEPSRPKAFAALVVGALITVGFYASILALDTGAIDSWGAIANVDDVIDHFLRRAYGTFRLSGYENEVNVLNIFRAFFVACGAFAPGALVLVVAGCAVHVRSLRTFRAWWLTLACLVAYIATFFPRMNSGGHILHDGVRERFFLLPIALLTALGVRVVLPPGRATRLVPAFAMVLALIAGVQVVTGDAYGYRTDTVVEDYARNLLNLAKSAGKPALLLVETDTHVFSLQYVAATEPGYEDVVAFGIGNIFLVDRLKKVQQRFPRFVYDVDTIFKDEKREVFRGFIDPNVDDFAVFTTMPMTSPNWRTTFYPLARRIERGTGVAIADAPMTIRPPVHKADSADYVETKEMYADYAVQYLARGKALLAMGQREQAKQAFQDGLERVPYCLPCLKNWCVLDENRDARCGEPLQSLAREYHYLE